MALPNVIHRIELPLDDRPHGIDLTGEILHSAVRRPTAVDVWYFARRDDTKHMGRSFQIVATGQPLPAWLFRHHQTCISPDGALVWHVLENLCPHGRVLDVSEMKDPPERPIGLCDLCNAHMAGNGLGEWMPL